MGFEVIPAIISLTYNQPFIKGNVLNTQKYFKIAGNEIIGKLAFKASRWKNT